MRASLLVSFQIFRRLYELSKRLHSVAGAVRFLFSFYSFENYADVSESDEEMRLLLMRFLNKGFAVERVRNVQNIVHREMYVFYKYTESCITMFMRICIL